MLLGPSDWSLRPVDSFSTVAVGASDCSLRPVDSFAWCPGGGFRLAPRPWCPRLGAGFSGIGLPPNSPLVLGASAVGFSVGAAGSVSASVPPKRPLVLGAGVSVVALGAGLAVAVSGAGSPKSPLGVLGLPRSWRRWSGWPSQGLLAFPVGSCCLGSRL